MATAGDATATLDLRVESKSCPLGIDISDPALSWRFPLPTSSQVGLVQKAYRIFVASHPSLLEEGKADVWDSDVRESPRSVHVEYRGKALESRRRYYVKVLAWDEAGAQYESPVSWWEMGLLSQEDWSARWIAAADVDLPVFRHQFRLEKPIARARVAVSGLGHYELWLNGARVGQSVLDPGWTNYNKTCLYSLYDVRSALLEGTNVIGVLLGNGHYNVTGGRYTKYRGSFGKPKVIVQLDVEFTDGTTTRIISDEHWRCRRSPITFSCIYGGEDYDARLLDPGFHQPDFKEGPGWSDAILIDGPKGDLRWQSTEPIKVMQTLPVKSVTEPEPGVFVVDFGQNFSGWVRISASGTAGSQVVMKPGEVLVDGLVSQSQTGSPYQFSCTLDGNGMEMFEPRFSYYGFRYVQVEGARLPLHETASHSDLPVVYSMEGCMIYPDIAVAGRFECSNSLLNQIHHIIDWAILSNTKSVFTDCPHREKLGWLEQTHLMGPSLMYNYDVESLFQKVVDDMGDAQLDNGMVPTTAPEYTVFDGQWGHFRDSVPWGIAYILLPWYLMTRYGNPRAAQKHYEGMERYVDYLQNTSVNHIVQGGLGDWYDVGENPPGYAQNTPVPLVETAFYYHAVKVMGRIASALGKREDARAYDELAFEIRKAFRTEFFNPQTNSVRIESQASIALVLAFGLCDDENVPLLLEKLITDISSRGYHTTAGDVGHRTVIDVLTQFGRSDVVYRMACQTDHPSYGYQVQHGATTLTEAWDGPTVGHSQNHFMLGHIEQWFYEGLAGIHYGFDEELQQYRVRLRPALGNDLEWVRAHHDLPIGRIAVDWRRAGEATVVELTSPPNCITTVELDVGSETKLTVDGRAWTRPGHETTDKLVRIPLSTGNHFITISHS